MEAGQTDIKHSDVGLGCRTERQRGQTVAASAYALEISDRGEKLDEHFADGSLVLNDNKMFHRKSERLRVNL